MKKRFTALLLSLALLFASVSFAPKASAYSNDFPLVNEVVSMEVYNYNMIFDDYGLNRGSRMSIPFSKVDPRFDLRAWFVIERSNEAGYYHIRPAFTNHIFDIMEYSRREGAAVILWNRNNQDNQKFRFTRQPNGKYVIQAKHSNQALTRNFDRGYNKFTPSLTQVPLNRSWSANREWSIKKVTW